MTTTTVTTWAVDLKDIGAVYPFQGSEGLMVIIAVATWIGWHIWCHRWEKDYHQEKIRKYGDEENLKKAIAAE